MSVLDCMPILRKYRNNQRLFVILLATLKFRLISNPVGLFNTMTIGSLLTTP